MESTRSIIDYYVDLLIMQYVTKPKARGTIALSAEGLVLPQKSVQTISFYMVNGQPINPSDPGYFGYYRLGYEGRETDGMYWTSNAAALQAELRTLTLDDGLTVVGDVVNGFIVTFVNNIISAHVLEVTYNDTYGPGFVDIKMAIAEVDPILPLAIQDAFNILPGSKNAIGVQLDILGKYAGVTRNGRGFSTFLTLDDDDFRLLIRAAIATNSLGSSFYEIQQFLYDYFPGQIFAYDYGNMRLGYFIAPGTISSDLLQTFIGQRLLPKPMGVSIYPIIYSITDELLFGFDSYERVNPFASPFNSYENYSQDVTWLNYAFIVSI